MNVMCTSKQLDSRVCVYLSRKHNGNYKLEIETGSVLFVVKAQWVDVATTAKAGL